MRRWTGEQRAAMSPERKLQNKQSQGRLQNHPAKCPYGPNFPHNASVQLLWSPDNVSNVQLKYEMEIKDSVARRRMVETTRDGQAWKPLWGKWQRELRDKEIIPLHNFPLPKIRGSVVGVLLSKVTKKLPTLLITVALVEKNWTRKHFQWETKQWKKEGESI